MDLCKASTLVLASNYLLTTCKEKLLCFRKVCVHWKWYIKTKLCVSSIPALVEREQLSKQHTSTAAALCWEHGCLTQSRKRDYRQLGNLIIYLFLLLWGGGGGKGVVLQRYRKGIWNIGVAWHDWRLASPDQVTEHCLCSAVFRKP